MADQELVVDQDGFPAASEGRTRHAPLRSRSRTTPQRTNSAADGSSEKTSAISTDVQSGLRKVNSSGNLMEKDFSGSAAACASPKRRSPGRSKSGDEQDRELLDLAKAQLALNPVPSLGDKVKMKVIVRKKKGTKDPTRTPSPGVKNRRSIKVPAGTLDIAALDVVKDENAVSSSNKSEKRSDSSRGREVLLKDRNARSSSRRSTRSRSRGGRIQSVKINLDEDDSDTDVLEDVLDEDHGDVASGGAENREEPGTRGPERKKGSDTPPSLNAPEDDKVKSSVAPRRESGGRDRFTSASEWSNVVDDLVQKRPDEKEADKDTNKNKSRGLGRLFNTGRKQTTD